eukprot:scaffold174364_cov36-Prasinocladus_malaysianus.AAC.1
MFDSVHRCLTDPPTGTQLLGLHLGFLETLESVVLSWMLDLGLLDFGRPIENRYEYEYHQYGQKLAAVFIGTLQAAGRVQAGRA